MFETNLQDFIAREHGIELHRKRSMKAFATVHDGPLLDVLFNLTRPTLRKKIDTKHAAHHPTPLPTIVRKGMVNYRNEVRHDF